MPPCTEGLDLNWLTNPFTELELASVIGDLQAGAAAGLDGIVNQLIINIGKIIMPVLLAAFNAILARDETFPPEFKTARICLIPKKGDLHSISNWRPISVTSNIFKIYAKSLTRRLSKVLPNFLGEEQKAYLNKINTSELSANLIEVIANNCHNDLPTYLLSID